DDPLISRLNSRYATGKLRVCFGIVDERSSIQFYAIGDRCLRADAEIDIPEILYFEIVRKRSRMINSDDVVGIVAETAVCLDKGADPEAAVESEKAFCSQRSDKSPVFFKVIFYRRGIDMGGF